MTPEPTKFLLVDDTPENLVALEALLRRDGLELLKARSGAEALELLLRHDVALALLDVQMPEMDGFELAELMRGSQRTRHVPIIFVTAGNRDPQRVFRGYEHGAVDFLFKPIDPHVLKSKADVFFALDAQRRELARALRMNELFVGILGHDLRNPLGAILTGAELLESKITDPAQQRTLGRITAACDRMGNMIEQLLDLTRARLAGGLGFARNRVRLDVAQVVQRAADELRGADPTRDVTVDVRGDATIAGDVDRLLQLFSNLIGNALRHGTPGSAVAIAIEGGATDVAVRIHNRGAIAPELCTTLFDPFRERRAGAPRPSGLGLGLYITQQIAVAHGGAVEVASSEADGTTFTVRLPRRTTAPMTTARKPAGRILVIDDDENIRDSLRDALEAEGYQVAVAASGYEALVRLRAPATRPDLLVIDLGVPIVDGAVLTEALRDEPALASLRIITSSTAPPAIAARATTLARPIDLARLLEAVAAAFR